jgi:hypothetical protein
LDVNTDHARPRVAVGGPNFLAGDLQPGARDAAEVEDAAACFFLRGWVVVRRGTSGTTAAAAAADGGGGEGPCASTRVQLTWRDDPVLALDLHQLVRGA